MKDSGNPYSVFSRAKVDDVTADRKTAVDAVRDFDSELSRLGPRGKVLASGFDLVQEPTSRFKTPAPARYIEADFGKILFGSGG
jgi:hypothetical protein